MPNTPSDGRRVTCPTSERRTRTAASEGFVAGTDAGLHTPLGADPLIPAPRGSHARAFGPPREVTGRPGELVTRRDDSRAARLSPTVHAYFEPKATEQVWSAAV